MDRNDYLKYISHFVEKVDQLATDTQYKSFFLKHLGKEMFAASDAKIKETALHLYKAYLLGTIIKIQPFELASLTSTQLSSLIGEEKKLIEKYKLDFPLEIETTVSKMEVAMRKQSSAAKKVALEVFATPKKAPAKPKAPRKPAGAKPKAKAKTPVKTVKKTAAKTPVKKVPTGKGKVVAKKGGVAECKKKYTLPELKQLAKQLKVKSYSKMNKEQLCKAMKL